MSIHAVDVKSAYGMVSKMPFLAFAVGVAALKTSGASGLFVFDIIGTLGSIQSILMHLGPALSAVLFVLAGVFYAVGQLFPSQKRAALHSASIDIIIGAIIVAVLSVASTGLAVASTSLLTNVTANVL